MPKKKYNSNSLYFTDRKAYYEQKSSAKQDEPKEPNHFEVFSNKENLEKGIGMVSNDYSRDGFLGRTLANRNLPAVLVYFSIVSSPF